LPKILLLRTGLVKRQIIDLIKLKFLILTRHQQFGLE